MQDLLLSTCVQLQTLCLWQIVTIVFGQVDTIVTTLGEIVPQIIYPASYVLTMIESTHINHDV